MYESCRCRWVTRSLFVIIQCISVEIWIKCCKNYWEDHKNAVFSIQSLQNIQKFCQYFVHCKRLMVGKNFDKNFVKNFANIIIVKIFTNHQPFTMHKILAKFLTEFFVNIFTNNQHCKRLVVGKNFDKNFTKYQRSIIFAL